MEFSIAFQGDGFVLIAADTAAAHSIVMFKKGLSIILMLT